MSQRATRGRWYPRPSEVPCQKVNDELQHAQVVEHGRQGGEEDDDRQHLEGEHRSRILVWQDGTEEELYSGVG